jgi:mono/diheme cytochrome c family protein
MNDSSRRSGALWVGAAVAVIVVIGLVYVGVHVEQGNTSASAVRVSSGQATSGRWYPPEVLETGGALYRENCSSCHGEQAQGAPDWRQRGPEGKWPPPPLNGTGHAWHHPLPALYQVIMNGSPAGSGNMPAWKGKLTREEVLAVIAWFQSQWPDEIYVAWARRDADYQRSRHEGG